MDDNTLKCYETMFNSSIKTSWKMFFNNFYAGWCTTSHIFTPVKDLPTEALTVPKFSTFIRVIFSCGPT